MSEAITFVAGGSMDAISDEQEVGPSDSAKYYFGFYSRPLLQKDIGEGHDAVSIENAPDLATTNAGLDQ